MGRPSAALAALAAFAAFAGSIAPACGSDPRYLIPRAAIEVHANPDAADDDGQASGQLTIVLPIRLETQDERTRRERLAQDMGLTSADVPYVKLDDLDVSLEWTVRNLDDTDGIAFIDLNGANERYRFNPATFVADPTGPAEDPPPSLLSGAPLSIPALATISGVIREGQLRESAIDLELITRAGVPPLAAELQVNEDLTELIDDATGVAIPARLLFGMVEYTVTLRADRHMVLELAVRVRDHRGLLHDELDGAPAGELTAFSPTDFSPPAPAMP